MLASNTATYGAGVAAFGNATLWINSSKFDSNSATQNGGGLTAGGAAKVGCKGPEYVGNKS